MKIARVDVFVLGFPFKSVFVLAGGVAGAARTRCRTACSSSSTTESGAAGWGEATPTPRWTYETTETIVSTLRRYLAPAVLGIEVWNFDALHRAMERAISARRDARLAAREVGASTSPRTMRWGRALGVPVYQLLGGCRRSTFDLTLDGLGAAAGRCRARSSPKGSRPATRCSTRRSACTARPATSISLRRARARRRRSLRCRSMRTAATASTPRCARRAASPSSASRCSSSR